MSPEQNLIRPINRRGSAGSQTPAPTAIAVMTRVYGEVAALMAPMSTRITAVS
jgi:hypothetical protein